MICRILKKLLDDPMYKLSCAVGFSGVLFALKVLNNHYHPGGTSNIMGIQVSNKYACWLELLAIHLLNPRSSFGGHLAGILVGLIYIKSPLKPVMEACAGERNSDGSRSFSYSGYPSYTPRDYNMYTDGLSEEEQFQRAMRNSLNDAEDCNAGTFLQENNLGGG
uniref:Uncharacterized protein n=1 Tax=Sphaerodactylus townsendi TaxID=933632 RepID=A0ACB8FAR4_9SAUR